MLVLLSKSMTMFLMVFIIILHPFLKSTLIVTSISTFSIMNSSFTKYRNNSYRHKIMTNIHVSFLPIMSTATCSLLSGFNAKSRHYIVSMLVIHLFRPLLFWVIFIVGYQNRFCILNTRNRWASKVFLLIFQVTVQL